MSGAVAQGITVQVTEGVGGHLVAEGAVLTGALVNQGNIQHRTIVTTQNTHSDIVTGTVQRLNGDDIAERIAHTKSLNIRLTIISNVLPVTIDIDSQGTVITVDGITGELILPGIYIGDSQSARNDQWGTTVFSNAASITASDHCRGISRHDGPNIITAVLCRRSAVIRVLTAAAKRSIIPIIVTINDRDNALRGIRCLSTAVITGLGAT